MSPFIDIFHKYINKKLLNNILYIIFSNNFVIFLTTILFFGSIWRIGVFINDDYTIANTLIGVSNGHLNIKHAVYKPEGWTSQQPPPTPGTHRVSGQVYGRNYGHVFLTLPLLWGLEVSTSLANPSMTLSLLWSVLLGALVVTISPSLKRQRFWIAAGLSMATLLLLANITLADPIDPKWNAWMALQLSTMVAAALVAVFVYRLVERMYDQRIGAIAGLASVLATPVGFWATIPKRHSFSALFPLVTLYCFYRSREATDIRNATKFRALAYVPVGLATWVHAPEGLILFVALGTIDVVTARSNAPRSLAIVGITFTISLLPFFLTNVAIAGNPLEPPRALPSYEGGSIGESDGSTGDPTDGVGAPPIFFTAIEKMGVFLGYMSRNAETIFNIERILGVFVRSDHALGFQRGLFGWRSVNLSVLESMPLAGILLVTPVVVYNRVQDHGVGTWDWKLLLHNFQNDPKRATDLMAVSYLVLLVIMYLPRLPIHVSFTVRYLHPLYPISVYLIIRFQIIRKVLKTEWRLLMTSYVLFVVFGGPLLSVLIATVAGKLDQAVQLHAQLALAAAAVLVYWGYVSSVYEGYERAGAVVLALTGAITTLYVLFSAWLYFPYTDQFALPISRQIAEFLVRRVADWPVSL